MPGLRSVASTRDGAGVGQGPAGRGVLGVHELRAGQQHGRALAAGQQADVVGVQQREVVDGARALLHGHRHAAHGRQLLDVRAQRQVVRPCPAGRPGAGRRGRRRSPPRRRRAPAPAPRRGGPAAPPRPRRATPRASSPRARRAPAGPSCAPSAPPGPPGARRARAGGAPGRRAGRSPTCPPASSCRAAASRRRGRRPAPAPRRRSPASRLRADERMPPPRRLISAYGTPVTFSSYSSARHAANGRCVWQSTRPGSRVQPDASMRTSAAGSSSSATMRPPPAVREPGARRSSAARSWRR